MAFTARRDHLVDSATTAMTYSLEDIYLNDLSIHLPATAKVATAKAKAVCLREVIVMSNIVMKYWAKTIELVALNLVAKVTLLSRHLL